MGKGERKEKLFYLLPFTFYLFTSLQAILRFFHRSVNISPLQHPTIHHLFSVSVLCYNNLLILYPAALCTYTIIPRHILFPLRQQDSNKAVKQPALAVFVNRQQDKGARMADISVASPMLLLIPCTTELYALQNHISQCKKYPTVVAFTTQTAVYTVYQ